MEVKGTGSKKINETREEVDKWRKCKNGIKALLAIVQKELPRTNSSNSLLPQMKGKCKNKGQRATVRAF